MRPVPIHPDELLQLSCAQPDGDYANEKTSTKPRSDTGMAQRVHGRIGDPIHAASSASARRMDISALGPPPPNMTQEYSTRRTATARRKPVCNGRSRCANLQP